MELPFPTSGGALRERLKSASDGSFVALVRQVREDWYRHDAEWMRPGFHAVATHRVATWLRSAPGPVRVLLAPLVTVLYLWNRNVYGIELPAGTVVGRRLRISHQGGIVIHGSARIGDDCVIRQNVTIGAVNPERATHAPTLGTGVEVGAGAAIIGRVTVGDGARIGPNAVIMSNVPAGSTAFAPNARVIQVSRRPTAVPEQHSTA